MDKGIVMPSSSPLSIEARQVAWSRLWQVLLREPTTEEAGKWESEPSSESPKTGEAVARAPPRKEVVMTFLEMKSPNHCEWSRLRCPERACVERA